MVSNTSELLPDPETPVNAVSRRLGSSTLTSLRLFSRAPCTRMRSWLSAACTASVNRFSQQAGSVDRQGGEGLLRVLVPAHPLDRVPPAALHRLVGWHVGGVAGPDRLAQVPVLGLDHLVGRLAGQGE